MDAVQTTTAALYDTVLLMLMLNALLLTHCYVPTHFPLSTLAELPHHQSEGVPP